jgi:hypothetical protein
VRRILNGVLWLIGLVAVLVLSFVVPVGRYTLFEHARRIAATEPARDLERDLGEAGDAIGESARSEWERRVRETSTP